MGQIMSAIAAVLALQDSVLDSQLAQAMVMAQGLRGRDGTQVWSDGLVSMCLGRLDTCHTPTPPALYDAESRIAVVADIRLDNTAELCAQLGLATGTADARIISAAYVRWGTRCVERLLGDFAFVLWDARRRQLFCARDQLGIKQLAWSRGQRDVRFASDVASLARLAGGSLVLNEARLAEHLAGVLCDEHDTVWVGIEQLGPAEAMTVSAEGRSRRWRYWEPDVHGMIRYPTLDEYAEHWGSLFTEAVRTRLRTDGPVLLDLSGGLDSSSVVSTAAMLRARGESVPPLHAASIVSTAEGADERSYAASVIKRWPMEWLQHSDDGPLPSDDLLHETGRVQDIGPWPDDLGGVGLMDTAARIPGLRVQLTGQGGDFWNDGGGQTVADALARMKLVTAATETRAWADSDRPADLLSALFHHGIVPLLGPRLPLSVAARRWRCPEWIGPEFARRTELHERMLLHRNRLAGRSFRSPSQRARFALVHDPMTQWGLLLDDRAGARRGIEERHPYHDRRLVEFALQTPEWTRSSGGRNRLTQRRAMKGILPSDVCSRTTKAEFSNRFARAFVDLLRPRLNAGLRVAQRGWVDPNVVARQLDECLAAPTWRPHCYPLASVLGVELLLETLEAGPVPAK